MQDIQLLITDLDGTLVGKTEEHPLYGDFCLAVRDLQEQNNTVWAICTGRSLKSFKRIFTPMQLLGIKPDFIIINHAYIYSLSDIGHIPHILWNFRIRLRQWKYQLHDRKSINKWFKSVRGIVNGIRAIHKAKDRLSIRFNSNESANIAMEVLKQKMPLRGHLKLFKYFKEIDIRRIPFTKGLAVSELARHFSIKPKNIMAIGNGQNDVSMLNGEVAKLTGCPSNSDLNVIEVVHHSHGHISSKSSLAGVLEIIDAFKKETVCSDLPKGWKDPAEDESLRPKTSHKHDDTSIAANIIVLLAIAYITLLTFANFGLVPFANLIMKPFRFLISLLTDMFCILY